MKEERIGKQEDYGRFLKGSHRRTMGRCGIRQCLSLILLLVWDGLLLYMIVECLIAPVYGAAFVAVVSVYLGNKL